MQKNVAGQIWTVFAFNRTTNEPETGDAANITGNLYLDGVLNAIDDTNPTETEDGFYDFDITQAESNADHISIMPASSTANIQVIGSPASLYTRPPDFQSLAIDGSGIVQSNVKQISDDATPADNLELQYDGTGISGDTFPATQAQLSGIANVGSAVNRTAASYVLTTGTQSSGTIASVAALDGTNHEHTDTAGAMDLIMNSLSEQGSRRV